MRPDLVYVSREVVSVGFLEKQDSATRICVQAVHLGGGPRKHWWRNGDVRQGRKGRQQRDCYQASWLPLWAAAPGRQCEPLSQPLSPVTEVAGMFVTNSPFAIGGGQLLQVSPVSSLCRVEVSTEGVHRGQLCSGRLPRAGHLGSVAEVSAGGN